MRNISVEGEGLVHIRTKGLLELRTLDQERRCLHDPARPVADHRVQGSGLMGLGVKGPSG